MRLHRRRVFPQRRNVRYLGKLQTQPTLLYLRDLLPQGRWVLSGGSAPELGERLADRVVKRRFLLIQLKQNLLQRAKLFQAAS